MRLMRLQSIESIFKDQIIIVLLMHHYLLPLQFLWWMCIPTQTPDEWRPREDTTWWTTFCGFVFRFIIIRRKYLLGAIVDDGDFIQKQKFANSWSCNCSDGMVRKTDRQGSWITKRWLLAVDEYMSYCCGRKSKCKILFNYILGGLLDEWSKNKIKI